MKIASDDEYEPEGEVEERLKEALTQLKEEKPTDKWLKITFLNYKK